MRAHRWPSTAAVLVVMLAGCAGGADPGVTEAADPADEADEAASVPPADGEATSESTGEGAPPREAREAGEPASPDAPSSGATSTTHRIETDEREGFAFAPARLEVAVGDTVVWEMVGAERHTVTGSGLNSGVLDPGDTYEITVTEPGEIDYLCYLHTGMTGTLTVE